MTWRAAGLGAVALALTALVAGCSAAARPAARPTVHPAARPAARTPARAAPRPEPRTSPPAYRYLTDLSDGAQARRYGFNLVDLGPYRSQIDALPSGERALVWLGGYSDAMCSFGTTDAQVRGEVSALAGDPQVAGYYIADEADDALPAYGGHCPHVEAQVAARSRLVSGLAPGAFTYEVVTEPGNFAAFARATDVLGADPYPCRTGRGCDWSTIPRYIAALDAAHVPRYWGVIQAFGYQSWQTPTPGELARMIAQWQNSRWQGEQVYAWADAGWSLESHPELLAELRALNLDGLRSPGYAS